MALQVWLDGRLVPEEEARVSVFDHGLLYGDGVFEGIRAYDGIVFRLKEHLDRLYNGARVIMLDIPLSQEEMTQAVLETIRANGLRDAYIRLVVTRGVGDLGLDPRKCPRASVFIIAAGIALYPEEVYINGLRLITCSVRRNSPDALDGSIKSLNYLNNIMAKMEAIRAGVPEGIMLTTDGYVAECTGDNIFLVRGERLITPPTSIGNLPGITRGAVMEIAARQGLEVREELFRLASVYTAEEVFVTGTAAEIVPVVEVDGRPVGAGKPGPVTKRLLDGFRELTKTDGEPIYP
ncbi:MAG: branched-chain-amino-acid transaminase [Armatimonadetes bacterium]|nr:branched-chain-amino-acid transaminase [Armatimonadota bacterium]